MIIMIMIIKHSSHNDRHYYHDHNIYQQPSSLSILIYTYQYIISIGTNR